MNSAPLAIPSSDHIRSGRPFEAQIWLAGGTRLKTQVPRNLWFLSFASHHGNYAGLALRAPFDPRLVPSGGMAVQVRARVHLSNSARVWWIDGIQRLECPEIVCGARLLDSKGLSREGQERLERLVVFHEGLSFKSASEFLTRLLVDPQFIDRTRGSHGARQLESVLEETSAVLMPGDESPGHAGYQLAKVALALQRQVSLRGVRASQDMPENLRGIISPELWEHLRWLRSQDSGVFRYLCTLLVGIAQRDRFRQTVRQEARKAG